MEEHVDVVTGEDTDSEFPLQLQGVTVLYPRSERPVLDRIDLNIRRGEFLGIIGPTGCGKSTLLALMCGIIPHYLHVEMHGDVLLHGKSTHDLSLAQFAAYVGMVLQDPDSQLFNLLVNDELVWGLENRGTPRERQVELLKDVLEFFRIEPLAQRITYDLSGGEKQRVAMAATYISRPEILILDNPTSQLDPRGSGLVIESIRRVLEAHQTVVMVEDKIDELIEHADRLIVMDEGKIVLEGTPAEICRNLDILDAAGLAAPEIPELFERLRQQGYPLRETPKTVEEAVSALNGSSASPVRVAARAERQETRSRTVESTSAPPILKVDNLSFTYPPPHQTNAVKDVDMSVAEPTFLAIIGQNGSGKTTLARCMSGYLKPTRGRVLIDGHDVHRISIRERAQLIGYVFQNPETQLFTNSVHEEVMYGLNNLKVPPGEAEQRAEETLRLLGLWDQRDVHPFRLSYGDKQRLAIATIAVLRPHIVVVDEPTTGQDRRQAEVTMGVLQDLLTEFKLTVIVITHSMPLVVRYCEHVVAMCRGSVLLEGPPREVFAQEQLLAETFVEPPHITRLGLQLGLATVPLTVDEAVDMFGAHLAGEVS